MAISGVNPKCYILALFVRDDGARFLLGDDPFEFKDNQLHFQQNTMANDVVEVQGNDGYLLAGQVRRPGTQMFDGYVCNGTNSKEEVEVKRRAFLQFFRRSHFYKVIYIFPNGTAIQRKQGFLVDDPTVQELYQQYPEYHVALNFEDVNYYTYEEDDQGQEIYAKEAIVQLAGGGATGGLIWDEYGVVWEDPWSLPLSISGVQFQILNNAGARAPIDNVELYGDTYQQSYSGKNLCNLGTKTVYQYELFALANSLPAGTYTFSAQVTSDDTTGTTCFVRFMNGNSGVGSGRIARSSDRTSITVTTTNTADGIYLYAGYDASQSAGDTATYTDIQVESGSSATSYEPYTGGQPAPNPDYPQPIQVVTGEQTVRLNRENLFDKNNINKMNAYFDSVGLTITSDAYNRVFYVPCEPNTNYHFVQGNSSLSNHLFQVATTSVLPAIGVHVSNFVSSSSSGPADYLTDSDAKYLVIRIRSGDDNATFWDGVSISKSQTYPISLTGKNLFNVSATPTYLNGVSVSGNLTVTATSSGTGKYALYRLVEAKNYVGSKVCVSCSTMHPSSTNDARIEIGLCNADGTSKTPKAYTNNVNIKPTFTVTYDPGKPYIYVALYASYSSSASVGDYVGYGKVMVNRGSTPGAYASYSPIELCKIGTYQDYIYKSEGDWYVHKELSSISFNGSENWNYASGSAQPFRYTITNARQLAQSQSVPPDVYSNYYTPYAWNNSSSVNYGVTASTNSSSLNIICFRNVDIASLASWKTWLSTHNTIVYYALATPTDTKITDTTLVRQLEALGAMKLFIGENNVLVSTPTPNLPATLAFDYYTKFATIGAEWEEGGTKGATIVNVDAIDNTYPVWQLTGPATNPTLSVLTTNTALTYNGTITASQKLVIDMFNKTATLNGTSVIGNVSGDFVYMAPGTNRLAYTADNTDAPDSTIYWQEVVG